jgi:hypothetical protein
VLIAAASDQSTAVTADWLIDEKQPRRATQLAGMNLKRPLVLGPS